MPFSDEYTLPKIEDARLRDMARRHGYTLRKSRWRLDSPDNLGGYMVVDPAANLVVAGARFDLTGADVAAWLTD